MNETLAGFIGDIYGNENQVLLMEPVSYDGENYYRHTRHGPLQIDAFMLEWVHEPPDDLVEDWAPGMGILFVGCDVAPIRNSMYKNRWRHFGGGNYVRAVEVVEDSHEHE